MFSSHGGKQWSVALQPRGLPTFCDNNVGQYYKVLEIYCTLYIAYYVNYIYIAPKCINMTLYFEHESAEINETICLLQVIANM